MPACFACQLIAWQWRSRSGCHSSSFPELVLGQQQQEQQQLRLCLFAYSFICSKLGGRHLTDASLAPSSGCQLRVHNLRFIIMRLSFLLVTVTVCYCVRICAYVCVCVWHIFIPSRALNCNSCLCFLI